MVMVHRLAPTYARSATGLGCAKTPTCCGTVEWRSQASNVLSFPREARLLPPTDAQAQKSRKLRGSYTSVALSKSGSWSWLIYWSLAPTKADVRCPTLAYQADATLTWAGLPPAVWHQLCGWRTSSITSSAWASNVGAISNPGAFAVWRLIIGSNFAGCSTGRSAGLSPLRMRPGCGAPQLLSTPLPQAGWRSSREALRAPSWEMPHRA